MRFPHPVVLLLGGIAVAAVLTWTLPAGEFERRDDPATGRSLVVAGTYHRVERAPVGPLGALVAVPRGLVAAAEVIVSILFVGGAFALMEQLGTLKRGVDALVRRFHGRGLRVIPVVAVTFATFGALENMQEEIIPLTPVLLVLGRGLGIDAISVVAMSLGAAIVGSAFGPTNPYQAGIALKLAQLPLLSGGALRLAMLAVALTLWVGWTMLHARRHQVAPAADELAGTGALSGRDAASFGVVLLAFGIYVVGVLRLDWGFNELSALFFFGALLIGVLGRLSLSDGMSAYLVGMQTVVGASVLVGVARGISVVLTDGRVIDTIVQSLASPLEGRPPTLAAFLMIAIQNVIHVVVPSVSGQAALTMPILIPTADLIGLSRQAAVVAYQTGAGLMEFLTPTNAALMAILLAAKVSYGRWLRFAVVGWALTTVVGMVGTIVAQRL
jgi:uncharacterized ion transporter superfamily protein YfcC